MGFFRWIYKIHTKTTAITKAAAANYNHPYLQIIIFVCLFWNYKKNAMKILFEFWKFKKKFKNLKNQFQIKVGFSGEKKLQPFFSKFSSILWSFFKFFFDWKFLNFLWKIIIFFLYFFLLPNSLQALSAEVSNVGAVSGESVQIGAGGEFDPNFFNRHRRLTSLYSSYGPEAAAILEAQKMASKRKPPGGQSGGGQLGGVGGSGGGIGGIGGSSGKGPSSLFIFSDDNFIRRHTRFIIEWPYPFHK